jgi:hypothetical protein
VLAIGENYCQAWIDRDAETVTRLTTDNPIVHTRFEFVGVDQVVALMEGLPYDIHTCGYVMKVDNWDAIGTIRNHGLHDLTGFGAPRRPGGRAD